MKTARTRSVAVLTLGLVMGAALWSPATADRAKTRTVKSDYTTPMFYQVTAHCGAGLGCVRIVPRARDRFVHVEISDATGTATYAYVNQDADGDGYSDIDGAICGRTESPLQVVPGVPIHVFVLAQWVPYCADGVGTQGTVTALFGSNYAAVVRAAKR